MKPILIKDTTREERIRIVYQALWGTCGIDCEFCSGCDNHGGGRIESIYQPYFDGLKEIREINADYTALSMYGGFEQFGPIGQEIVSNDVQTKTEPGTSFCTQAIRLSFSTETIPGPIPG